jgi:hypothetical protein
MSSSKEWELRCYLPDGQIAACPVSIDMRPDLARAVGATMESLIKHRLYDAYISCEHFVNPAGPELPAQLEDL